MRTLVCAVALLLSLSGCYTKPAPIPVLGSEADVQQLAGDWSGQYQSDNGGRSGTITFRLAAGADSAFGDVLMIPRGWPPHVQVDHAQAAPRSWPAPQTVPIRFVRTEAGTVTGSLAPYVDPECNCEVVTRFEGRLRGRVIEGTYTTRHTNAPEGHAGHWKVSRGKS